MRKLSLFLTILVLACSLPTARAIESLQATKSNSFKPITMAASRPTFLIPPDSPLVRNEHPRLDHEQGRS